MEIQFFRHLWGVEDSWEETFPQIKQAGYSGIENGLPDPTDRARFQDLLRAYDFSYIAQIFTQGQSVAQNLQSFREQIEAAVTFTPHLINVHSGLDSWSEAQSQDFFGQALIIEAEFGVPVAHETHRGRILYNPWVTSRLLSQFPKLKLCCDLSHWVCVCERLLTREDDIIQQVAQHCLHVHARVGYEEGPQVPDPRAPEYRVHLEAHEGWWQTIWQSQKARGMALTTLTPEFGPAPYLQSLPFTSMPVTNLSAVCDWMREREHEVFARQPLA